MVRLVKHNDLDLELWDRCIKESACNLVYAQSWYLDALTDQQWCGLVLDEYAAVMPLCYKSKYGIRYLAQPLFAQQLGVFSKIEITSSMCKIFLKAIPRKYWFVDMAFNFTNTSAINEVEVGVQPRINIELQLNKSYQSIHQSFSENTKRNIKKIKTQELRLHDSKSLLQVIDIFKSEKGRHSDIKEKDYHKLVALFAAGLALQKCFVAEVFDSIQNTLLAGALFIITDNRLIFLFSGMSQEGKNKKAMFYLINEIIKKYSQTSMILDFEGSMDENLARFYKGFGGSEIIYTHVQFNRLPKLLKWIKS